MQTKNTCPNCGKRIKKDFSLCPFCGITITSTCKNCGKKIESSWKVCGFCGANIDEDKPPDETVGKSNTQINETVAEAEEAISRKAHELIDVALEQELAGSISKAFKSARKAHAQSKAEDIAVVYQRLLEKKKAIQKKAIIKWGAIIVSLCVVLVVVVAGFVLKKQNDERSAYQNHVKQAWSQIVSANKAVLAKSKGLSDESSAQALRLSLDDTLKKIKKQKQLIQVAGKRGGDSIASEQKNILNAVSLNIEGLDYLAAVIDGRERDVPAALLVADKKLKAVKIKYESVVSSVAWLPRESPTKWLVSIDPNDEALNKVIVETAKMDAIVFSSGGLFLMNQTTNEQACFYGAMSTSEAAISPEGGRIAYVGRALGKKGDQIYVFDLWLGSESVVLDAQPSGYSDGTYYKLSNIRWLPDGKTLLLLGKTGRNSTDGIYSVDVATSGFKRISLGILGFDVRKGDGKVIASSWTNANAAQGRNFLSSMDSNGENALDFAYSNDYKYKSIAWSPDGTKIAAGVDTNSSYRNILVLAADGSLIKRLETGSSASISWSLDGTSIAYMYALDDAKPEIWSTSATSFDGKKIADGQGPCWGRIAKTPFLAKADVYQTIKRSVQYPVPKPKYVPSDMFITKVQTWGFDAFSHNVLYSNSDHSKELYIMMGYPEGGDGDSKVVGTETYGTYEAHISSFPNGGGSVDLMQGKNFICAISSTNMPIDELKKIAKSIIEIK